MIPYEDLCRALEAFAARNRGDAPTDHGAYGDPPPLDDNMPAEEPHAVLTTRGGDEESTRADMSPVYEDRSNELDIGDVLADEDS
jgi:hypothetical protein